MSVRLQHYLRASLFGIAEPPATVAESGIGLAEVEEPLP
jgi:hypothetical protein